MNTPAHLLLGTAVFGRGGDRRVIAAAMAGSLLPDLSLYLLAGGALYVFGYAPEIVFRELYYSDAWQTVFAIDNSFILWGLLLAVALIRRSPILIAFAGAGVLHLALDFPLHHDDARAHFWPVSDWVFRSPFSYWDPAQGAGWVSPVEVVLSAVAAVRIVMLRAGWWISGIAVLALVAELSVSWVWVYVFSP
ncbi:cobalamin biosynthesis protein CobQ [Sulfitobacter sp. HNIBRBA3233]|uniref:cobalamin biosynthesis protein CobQ n=1 Tax=Sulfitobacter marinivivus TaxID=3158558 RepID=UPI0032E02CB7